MNSEATSSKELLSVRKHANDCTLIGFACKCAELINTRGKVAEEFLHAKRLITFRY